MLKKFGTLVIILILIIATLSLGRQIYSSLRSSSRLDTAADSLSKLQAENRRLKRKLEEVSQYDSLEEIARDKLGLARSGETVVIISPKDIDQVLGAQKKVEEVKLPNWQGWLKLIFH